MSHALHVYLVDRAKLEAVVGSNNNKLLNRVLEGGPPWRRMLSRLIPPLGRQAEDSRRLSITFQISDQDGHVERNKAALRTIIAGGPFDEERAGNYVEALELICRQLGPYVGDATFWFGNDDLPFVIEDLATGMVGQPPFPKSERNGWGVMSKKSCTEELEYWEGKVAEDPDYSDGYGELVVEWLRASKAANKDLIGFWGG
ncbi:DUF7691 family protein [Nocardia sp.]|uniref:DUF7691 family protein n=1 Tax=Nocardia sp. TaxID=1821 RepID=UPI002621FA57|nr:hypothetical protein [Nocardia sp.]